MQRIQKNPANFRKYILGINPPADDLKLIGSRLPTKKQVVLLCFLVSCQSSATKHEATNKTVDGDQKLLDQAWIPIIQWHKMAEVEKYNKVFEGTLKISVI